MLRRWLRRERSREVASGRVVLAAGGLWLVEDLPSAAGRRWESPRSHPYRQRSAGGR
ncbi:hypothetical protein [Nonomuraea rhizosphaerae]|uniref:hypothetical protein n=1 Tax=Nonomuraea rhizosphaerae TaxID=2665663 RepID=UPI001C5EAE38|nr:hypothetical protein [Nonomuraea rhizosphaerae]